MPRKDKPWPPTKYPKADAKRKFEPTLKVRTYNALRQVIDNNTMTLREVAEGADVTWGWLRMFALNKIPDPAVSRIERLYHYLTGCVL